MYFTISYTFIKWLVEMKKKYTEKASKKSVACLWLVFTICRSLEFINIFCNLLRLNKLELEVELDNPRHCEWLKRSDSLFGYKNFFQELKHVFRAFISWWGERLGEFESGSGFHLLENSHKLCRGFQQIMEAQTTCFIAFIFLLTRKYTLVSFMKL